MTLYLRIGEFPAQSRILHDALSRDRRVAPNRLQPTPGQPELRHPAAGQFAIGIQNWLTGITLLDLSPA